jgi:hypothetical protein
VFCAWKGPNDKEEISRKKQEIPDNRPKNSNPIPLTSQKEKSLKTSARVHYGKS